HDAVPFRAFLALAGRLVPPGLRGRQREIRDARAVVGRADLRILADVADQNDFVDASGHADAPLLTSVNMRTNLERCKKKTKRFEPPRHKDAKRFSYRRKPVSILLQFSGPRLSSAWHHVAWCLGISVVHVSIFYRFTSSSRRRVTRGPKPPMVTATTAMQAAIRTNTPLTPNRPSAKAMMNAVKMV